MLGRGAFRRFGFVLPACLTLAAIVPARAWDALPSVNGATSDGMVPLVTRPDSVIASGPAFASQPLSTWIVEDNTNVQYVYQNGAWGYWNPRRVWHSAHPARVAELEAWRHTHEPAWRAREAARQAEFRAHAADQTRQNQLAAARTHQPSVHREAATQHAAPALSSPPSHAIVASHQSGHASSRGTH